MTFNSTLLLSLVLLLICNCDLQAGRPESFSQARKAAFQIYQELYPNGAKSKTFYCNCGYSEKRKIDESCKFARAKKLSWEHLVPAEKLGQAMGVWPYKKKVHGKWRWFHRSGLPWVTPEECIIKRGRKAGKAMSNRRCARKTSLEFRQAESDLYNLVPAISRLNKKRSSHPFAAKINEGETLKNGCMLEVLGKGKNRRAIAAKSIRGNIARAYLYMDLAHTDGKLLSDSQRERFQKWNLEDAPEEKTDCKRGELIFKKTGQVNPLIASPCKRLFPLNEISVVEKF